MLAAAGLPNDALLFRDARKPGWQRGLDQASAVLCDAYTATLPPLKNKHRIVFPLLAEASRTMLAGYTPGL